MDFSKATLKEIDKLYRGRHYVDLSIGLLRDGEEQLFHTNPFRGKPDREGMLKIIR